MTPTIKEQIWEAHPYMPRVKKLRLVRHLLPSYERVVKLCEYLEYSPPQAYDLPHCDVADDFLLIKDADNNSIADVYIGTDSDIVGTIILPNGTQVSGHRLLLLEGLKPNDYGYIDDCQCSDCQNALLAHQDLLDKERTERYKERASMEKVRSVSERVPGHVDAPRNVPPKQTIMKITSPTNDNYYRSSQA